MVFIAAAIGVWGGEAAVLYCVLCCCSKVWWTLVFGAWAGRSGEEAARKWLCEDGCDSRLSNYVPVNFESLAGA